MIEKLRENDAPLVTLVNIIGAFDAKPISTYTKRRIKDNNGRPINHQIYPRL